MQEAIVSAVTGEAMGILASQVVSNHDEKVSKRHNLEKLEMARDEMGYALERSSKYTITYWSLLRQRKMLKRKYEECDNLVHRHKQQALKDEENAKRIMLSYFPTRFCHYIKSKVSALVSNGEDELSSAIVRQYESWAHLGDKFLSRLETGGALWQPSLFYSYTRDLLDGKWLSYSMLRGSQKCYFRVLPVRSEDRGVEAAIWFHREDHEKPEKNFEVFILLQLSESTDIVRVARDCMKPFTYWFESVFTYRFESAIETGMQEFTDLLAQDVGRNNFHPMIEEFSDKIANAAKFCRPDPQCCKNVFWGAGVFLATPSCDNN